MDAAPEPPAGLPVPVRQRKQGNSAERPAFNLWLNVQNRLKSHPTMKPILVLSLLAVPTALLQADPGKARIPASPPLSPPSATAKSHPPSLFAQAKDAPRETTSGTPRGNAPVLDDTLKGLQKQTISSLDRESSHPDVLAPGVIKFIDGDLLQVLDVYQELSGRTVVRSTTLPLVKVSVRSQTPLNRIEALQLLDTALAQNGVTMIPEGTKVVKAVAFAQAHTEAAPIVDLSPEELPDSSSCLTYIVEVKNRKPSQVVPALQPFSKMSNSILAIDDAGIVILRDYSSNVRRMLQVLDRLERATSREEGKIERGKRSK